ncbi:MAG: amino acid adenylation domain-containing protein [Pirellulaceae bacterium]
MAHRLRNWGAKSGCSLFHMMLTSLEAFVGRLAGQDDFVIGIPTAGQNAVEMHQVVGHCVNTLPYRSRCNRSRNLLDAAKQTRSAVLDCLEHQRYTFGCLVRDLSPPRDATRPTMFPLTFNIDPAMCADEVGFVDSSLEIIVQPRAMENFEWSINGVLLPCGTIELQCQYNSDIFDAATMEGYLNGWIELLRTAVDSPDTPLEQLPIIDAPQRDRLTKQWNQTTRDFPIQTCVHEQISLSAAQFPDSIAVQCGDACWSHSDLEGVSNQIARQLQLQGVVPGDLVGVCMQRSEKLLATLLGIWKAGAGYVPLDAAYPIDRLKFMCEQSELKQIVCDASVTSVVETFGKPMLNLDDVWQLIRQQSDSAIHVAISPADIAYVIYTSGSTGQPKGVEVPHGAIVNFLFAMREQPGFGPDDRILATTTLSFDIAVLELFLPLICGGRTVIADEATTSDARRIADALQRHQITVFQATPSRLRQLIDSGWMGSKSLTLICGGEPMPADLAGLLLDRAAVVWNAYGPTETTVWSTLWQVQRDARISIGTPIANTQVFVLDENMLPVPPGVAGELYIGGAGVTLGYRHRMDLTEEKFVANPWSEPRADYVNPKLYRTGDVVRWTNDGNLQYLSRNDKQVKLRGYRIELDEIETAIASHPDVTRCVAVLREDVPGDVRLVAYMLLETGRTVTSTDLRRHLSQCLPSYMIPQHFVEVPKFPETSNGKIDRKGLPSPTVQTMDTDDYAEPETSEERLLAEIWCDVLDLDAVSVNDNFFNVGGHSLMVVQVISRVEQDTGVRLSPQDFLMQSLGGLAAQLGSSTDPVPVPLMPDVRTPESNGWFSKLLSPLIHH